MPHFMRLMETSKMLESLSTSPYDVYVEAMRRKTVLLERVRIEPKAKQRKTLSEIDALTVVIRTYYQNHEGGCGVNGYKL